MFRNNKKNGMLEDVFVVFIEIKAHPRTMVELMERFDNLRDGRLGEILEELQESYKIFKVDRLFVCKA